MILFLGNKYKRKSKSKPFIINWFPFDILKKHKTEFHIEFLSKAQ